MRSGFYKIIFFVVLVLLSNDAYASTTVGSIDSNHTKAQICENIACSVTSTSPINFGHFTSAPSYNVQITDTEVSGYLWSTHFGWIVMHCTNTTSGCSSTNGNFKVANDNEGHLSGYAWGENTGWINFGPFTNSSTTRVTINSGGEFNGYAWGENTGWIKFDCSDVNYCVKTDWRPRSTRPSSSFPLGIVSFLGLNNNSNTQNTLDTNTPVVEEDNTPDLETTIPKDNTKTTNEATIDDIAPTLVPPYEDIPNIQGPTTAPPSQNTENINTNDSPVSSITENLSFLNSLGDLLNTNILQTSNYFLESITQNDNFVPASNTASVVGLVAGVSIFVPSVSPVAFFGGSSNLVGSILIGNFGLYDIWLLLLRAWGLLLTYLGIRKKARPWGTVYDSVTKQPLDPVYVVLKDLSGKEVASAVTDIDGRYGFLVPAGTYQLSVRKTNYQFPSRQLSDVDHDELYTQLYKGEIITISDDGVIMKNIPMDPIKFDWNEFVKKQRNMTSFFSRHDVWVSRFSMIFFLVCFCLTLVSLLYVPTLYNFVMFLLYVVLFVVSKLLIKSRASGQIKVALNNRPLSFAIVRIFYAGLNTEYTHKVTNKDGLYYCLVPNGDYYMTIENKNIDGTYTLAYKSDIIHVKKGYINEKLSI